MAWRDIWPNKLFEACVSMLTSDSMRALLGTAKVSTGYVPLIACIMEGSVCVNDSFRFNGLEGPSRSGDVSVVDGHI